MVGSGSAGERAHAQESVAALAARERRALERARRALERGRRVRGRRVAGDERHGLLLDLRGALGHVPVADARGGRASSYLRRGGESQWEGWVVAVHADLVHLSSQRPDDDREGPVSTGEVVHAARSGIVVRLDDGTTAVAPRDELSWEPALVAPELPPGTRLAGRIVGLTLEGPVLSPRAVAPSPWPAIALALPAGVDVTVRLEAQSGGRALVRTDRAPRAAAIVPGDLLPAGLPAGSVFAATVAGVNVIAGTLTLEDVRPMSRAPRHARAAGRPGPQGPERVA